MFYQFDAHACNTQLFLKTKKIYSDVNQRFPPFDIHIPPFCNRFVKKLTKICIRNRLKCLFIVAN